MEIKQYEDAAGIWFLEIISHSNCQLRTLENEHQKIGRKTWLNLYNACKEEWVLTVQMGSKS
jgi:hypothetical protein